MPYFGCLAVQGFSTLYHEQQDFREKDTEHKTCFDILYKVCLKKFSLLKELSEIMCISPHVKYPLFLSDFN